MRQYNNEESGESGKNLERCGESRRGLNQVMLMNIMNQTSFIEAKIKVK